MINKIHNECFTAWGMRVDAIQMPRVLELMQEWIDKKETGNYIVVSNAHDALASKRDASVKEAVNKSSLSVPDGISMVLMAKIYGYHLKKRVTGISLMTEFLRIASRQNYSNFFYGSTTQTLNLLVKNTKEMFPNLNIKGTYSPPFGEISKEEDEKIIKIINDAAPDILWVGLGCPKQQLWMHDKKDKLKVPVIVGVGAAFDFLAKIKPQAPDWIGESGFEWLFRLVCEPKRLWKRYLVSNSLFTFLLIKEFINQRIIKKIF